MTPITAMPGILAAYTVSPWNNTQGCGTKQDDDTSYSNFNHNPNTKQHRGDKCNPTTPNGSEEKTSAHQRQKKPCCAVKVDTAAKEKTKLGMLYLRNVSINPLILFPKDMPEKICTNFICKGKECTNANCDFAHPKRPSELKRETILVVASHFIKRDNSWFNEYYFMKMPNITNKIQGLLGNTKGLNSKLA
jgi:hypothetical protein